MPRPAVGSAADHRDPGKQSLRPRLGIVALVASLLLAACEPASAPDSPPASDAVVVRSVQPATNSGPVPQGTGFDFYVLSLSWSPSYCQIEGERANRRQCDPARGFGFVVHGLWPQFEHGYPEFCSSREPERVPDALVSDVIDIMPSAGLVGHQWRKHGSCSGLAQRDYFALVRRAWQAVEIPPSLAEGGPAVRPLELEAALAKANPGLEQDAMGVLCEDGLIREVRICLRREDLGFRPCPEIDRRGCKRAAAMPAP